MRAVGSARCSCLRVVRVLSLLGAPVHLLATLCSQRLLGKEPIGHRLRPMNMRLAAGYVAVLMVSGCTNTTEQSAVNADSASITANSTASSESLGTLFGSFPACIGPGVNVPALDCRRGSTGRGAG